MRQTKDDAKPHTKDSEPMFSIVVPTYGRPHSLPNLLRSLAQTEFPKDRFEVVVVDDGSPEPVAPAVRCFETDMTLRVIRQENAGPAMARNRGIQEAKGTFIVLTDDDCCPRPDWLPRMAEVLLASPETMTGGHTVNGLPDSVCATISQAIIDRLYQVWNRNSEQVRFFTSNNMAAPRSGFLALGGFDLRYGLAGGEDRGLCDHWRSSGRDMRYVPEAIVIHFQEEDIRSFVKRHFRYGRGAVEYHSRRRTPLIGEARASASISSPLYWLRYAFSRPNGHGALKVLAILMLWQLANTGGFLWEKLRSLVRKDQADTGRTSS